MKQLKTVIALAMLTSLSVQAQAAKPLTDTQIENFAKSRCKNTFNLKEGTKEYEECVLLKIEEAKQRRERQKDKL